MKFKIRASQAGVIMTNPRTKKEFLSQTTITYLETWVKERIYGVPLEFSSKYTDKGNTVETSAIEYYSDFKGWGFVVRNEEYFENDFFTGTPDLLRPNKVIDIKSPWDCFTFPLFAPSIEEVNKLYDPQLQVYMNLTGRNEGVLAYVLSDTPEELQKGGVPVSYEGLPHALRVKEFSTKYNPEFIEALKQRVNDCQTYIDNSILPGLKEAGII